MARSHDRAVIARLQMRAPSLRNVSAILLTLTAVPFAWAAGELVSFLPAAGLARFIAEDWDIRTISSSLNPRRTQQQSHFTDLGLSLSEATDSHVVLEDPDETYVIEVLKRGDANRDGIEDVIVCFSESAKGGGTLAGSHAFLLQKYSKTTSLVALAFTVRDPQCQ
jgi:hypothetical protein